MINKQTFCFFILVVYLYGSPRFVQYRLFKLSLYHIQQTGGLVVIKGYQRGEIIKFLFQVLSPDIRLVTLVHFDGWPALAGSSVPLAGPDGGGEPLALRAPVLLPRPVPAPATVGVALWGCGRGRG